MNKTLENLRRKHAFALAGCSVWRWVDSNNSSDEIVKWGRVVPDTLAREICLEGGASFDETLKSFRYQIELFCVARGPFEFEPRSLGFADEIIDPVEPGCSDESGHDWVSGQSRCFGAGHRWIERCSHCELAKQVTRGAQDCIGFYDEVHYLENEDE